MSIKLPDSKEFGRRVALWTVRTISAYIAERVGLSEIKGRCSGLPDSASELEILGAAREVSAAADAAWRSASDDAAAAADAAWRSASDDAAAAADAAWRSASDADAAAAAADAASDDAAAAADAAWRSASDADAAAAAADAAADAADAAGRSAAAWRCAYAAAYAYAYADADVAAWRSAAAADAADVAPNFKKQVGDAILEAWIGAGGEIELLKKPGINKVIVDDARRVGLQMSTYHCGTSHCIAGWFSVHSGQPEIERTYSCWLAAVLVFAVNNPGQELPYMGTSQEKGLDELRRLEKLNPVPSS